MRIGIFGGEGSVQTIVDAATAAEADGFDSFWLPQIFGTDAMSALTVVGREVPRIELGTAVVPTFPRHPLVMAAQALTVSAASGGRFTLGIGLSHQMVIESMFGYSFDKPARHMREYLEVLGPVLSGQPVDMVGETVTARATIDVPDSEPVPVLVAALGPLMLNLAARLAAGTVTWMTGPRTLGEHTVPTITAAAEAGGFSAPRIVSALPVAVTDDAAHARERAAAVFQVYGFLPSYRAMLDKEGAAGPADVALVGTKAEVRAGIESIRDAGATDFVAVEFHGSGAVHADTRDVLREFL